MGLGTEAVGKVLTLQMRESGSVDLEHTFLEEDILILISKSMIKRQASDKQQAEKTVWI